MKRIGKYRTAEGREPFSEWFETLESGVQQKVDAYIVRAAMGGAHKSIHRLSGRAERDIFELSIDSGPGYRVYFGQIGKDALLLLHGGLKRDQTRDIALAVGHWRAFHVSK